MRRGGRRATGYRSTSLALETGDAAVTKPDDTQGGASRSARHHVADVGIVADGSVHLVGNIVAGRDVHLHPQPAEITPPPFQLPPVTADFMGRRETLDEMTLVLEGRSTERRGVSTLAISGKAGVGKTAVAVYWADTSRSWFPDGQLYLEMRGTERSPRSPAEALDDILHAVGVRARNIPERLSEKVSLYRSVLAGKRVLIIIDNAADEEQVRPFLVEAPACTLITSRERLSGLEAAHHLVVDVLSAESAVKLLGKVVGYDRVNLEQDAAGEIAELCGYLPLALRVTGAKLASRPSWRLEKMRKRLQDERWRLSELKVGDIEVRASLALSYNKRDELERRAFRLLGLAEAPEFSGWFLAALLHMHPVEAEAVAERLVDAQLLEIAREDELDNTHYRFHDLLRLLARERLLGETPEYERQSALRRLVQACVGLLSQASAALDSATPLQVVQDASRTPCITSLTEAVRESPSAWLTTERLALIATMRQANENGFLTEVSQLARAFSGFLAIASHWRDWLEVHEMALNASQRAGDARAQAEATRELGRALRDQQRWTKAIEVFRVAEGMFRDLEDPHEEAVTLAGLSVVYCNQGDLDQAIQCGQRAIPPLMAAHDQRWLAYSSRTLGMACRMQGRLDDANHHLTAAASMFEEQGDRHREAICLARMGAVLREQGHLDQAESLHLKSLQTFADMGVRAWADAAIVHLAAVRRDRGLLDEAIALLQDASHRFRELGASRWEAIAYHHAAIAHTRQGNVKRALALFHANLAVFSQLGDLYSTVVSHYECGLAHEGADDRHGATLHFHQAVTGAQRLGNYRLRARAQERYTSLRHGDHILDQEAEICGS